MKATTKPAQFTPGPWAADGAGILYAAPSEADEFEVIEINAPYNSQDRYLIAQVHAGFTQSQANAHLIAAAPVMYIELKEGLVLLEASHHDMVDMYGIDSLQAKTVWERIESTRNVIAQAEGR